MAVYVSNLAAGLERGLDNPEFLLKAVEPFQGRVGVEFFIHTCFPAYMNKMKSIPEWLGNIPRTLHGPFLGVEASSGQGTVGFQNLMDAYGQAWEIAKLLGCRHMVFHDHERFVKPEEKEMVKKNCLANLEVLNSKAQKEGITLLLENLGLPSKGMQVFDEQEYIELFDRFTDAGCLIDIGHLCLAGWDMERVIHRLSARIIGYHLHNNNRKDDSHCRIRDGDIDYEQFFKCYRRWTGWADITLEYGDGSHITPVALQEDLSYVMDRI